MKLFVDDIRICPDGWQLARTNAEAIRLLASGYVEVISLDHDINSINPNTGMMTGETYEATAHYLALMSNKPNIVFHSGNWAATRNLAENVLKIPYVRYEDVFHDWPKEPVE